MDNEVLVRAEIDRVKDLLLRNGVSQDRIALHDAVIENVAYMKYKLEEAREKIAKTSVVVKYDNGGGQKGVRENPAFKGYEALWKSYISGLEKILRLLPIEEAAKEVDDDARPKTVLEIVRARKGA